jgi:NAD(P)-dependent dehydrogenase (short-subunit alcohol dehydrogenase family)
MANELIKTNFGFDSTASEVVEGIDLAGKKAVVTGGSSGIGIETARALVKAGADVTLAVRNTEAGEQVAADIKSSTGNENVHVAKLDLSDRASIQSFAKNWDGPLHILVNNAGVMALQERELSEDGNETQFATNHLGHFELTLALHDALKAAGNARVVSVSSSAHFRSPVIFDDLNFNFRVYDPWEAYGQSKTANILFAVEATKRWAEDGITVNALTPGAIRTNLQRHVDGGTFAFTMPNLEKTVEQGASTSVLLATSPLLEGISGRYFVNNNEAEVVMERSTDMTGVAPYALDPDNAKKLWDESLRMLSLN